MSRLETSFRRVRNVDVTVSAPSRAGRRIHSQRCGRLLARQGLPALLRCPAGDSCGSSHLFAKDLASDFLLEAGSDRKILRLFQTQVNALYRAPLSHGFPDRISRRCPVRWTSLRSSTALRSPVFDFARERACDTRQYDRGDAKTTSGLPRQHASRG